MILFSVDDLQNNENDVFLGRGGGTNQRRHGSLYRKLILENFEQYLRLKPSEKRDFAIEKVIIPVQSNGGRFLVYDRDKARWVLAAQNKAAYKVMQALRDCKRPQITSRSRKKRSPETHLSTKSTACGEKRRRQKKSNCSSDYDAFDLNFDLLGGEFLSPPQKYDSLISSSTVQREQDNENNEPEYTELKENGNEKEEGKDVVIRADSEYKGNRVETTLTQEGNHNDVLLQDDPLEDYVISTCHHLNVDCNVDIPPATSFFSSAGSTVVDNNYFCTTQNVVPADKTELLHTRVQRVESMVQGLVRSLIKENDSLRSVIEEISNGNASFEVV